MWGEKKGDRGNHDDGSSARPALGSGEATLGRAHEIYICKCRCCGGGRQGHGREWLARCGLLRSAAPPSPPLRRLQHEAALAVALLHPPPAAPHWARVWPRMADGASGLPRSSSGWGLTRLLDTWTRRFTDGHSVAGQSSIYFAPPGPVHGHTACNAHIRTRAGGDTAIKK